MNPNNNNNNYNDTTSTMNEDIYNNVLLWPHNGSLLEWLVMLGFVFTTILCAVELTSTAKVVYNSNFSSSTTLLTRSTSSPDLGASTSASVRPSTKGDETRLEFYRLLFAALLSRLILLLFEGYLMDADADGDDGKCDVFCTVVRTLPDLAFASAFLHLVLFYGSLVETASGNKSQIQSVVSKIMFHPTFFRNSNILIYLSYVILLVGYYVKWCSYKVYESSVNFLLAAVYGILFFGIAYFGPTLIKILKPSLEERSYLAFRLASMCTVCTIVFPSRAIVFLCRATNGTIPFVSIDNFYNDNIAFLVLELIPSFLILLLMRHSRKKSNLSKSGSQQTSSGNLRRNYSGNSGTYQNKPVLLSKASPGSNYGSV